MSSLKLPPIIRFPAVPVAGKGGSAYLCPCGKYHISVYYTYQTGLDDADPDWGRGEEEYFFDPADPCRKKYRIIDISRGELQMVALDGQSYPPHAAETEASL